MDDVREMAGAVIMTGFPGTRLAGEAREKLERLRPSGVILFRKNVEDVEQLRALTAELHALPWRPWVAIDHEGGAITRLDAPFTRFPDARTVRRSGRPEDAYAVGRAMGRELASVGIDIDFAPVMDVDSNPANPVIGARSFGRTVEEVTRFALPFLDGLRDAGVLGCAKHFPGHGDTDRDSHLELPVVRHDREHLETVELPPFRAAIDHGVPMIMTAHVVYPALDPDRPATLSAAIMRELLRERMGFRGVLVSDALEMRGITGTMTVADAAVPALAAGVDWLLICQDIDDSLAAADAIARAVGTAELDTVRLREAAGRIAALPRPSPAADPIALPAEEHLALDRRLRSPDPATA